MRIASVNIENFGCIESASVTFGNYTTLIGPNNAGKSTILQAVDKFFSSAPKIEDRHYFRHDVSRVISITLKFVDLTPVERSEFASALIDGTLTVTRTFGGTEHGLYVVDALVHPAFQEFRNETDGTKRRSIYAGLRNTYGLASASGLAMEEQLVAWEGANPDKLERLKTRGFFGAPNVANGKLRKKTSLRFIPAVAEASAQTDNPKTSAIIELLSDIRRQTLENRPAFSKLVDDANTAIAAYVDSVEDNTIASISSDVTGLLQKYYSDTQLSAELPPPNKLVVDFPPPTLRVKHRAISGGVDHVGHGLQRAILFSVIQFLAQHFSKDVGTQDVFDEAASDIIVLVEEPEIYQHPLKQRIIRSVLEQICDEFDKKTGIRMQVVVCTHSEKFVRIKDIESVRIVRTNYSDDVYTTTIKSLAMERFRDLIFNARGAIGNPLPLNTFSAGLHVFSEAIAEGFFSDKVVLVEGVDDAAIVEGIFVSMGRNAQLQGISVIPVDGKTKLDKPLLAFRELGIKTYCLFDNDDSDSAAASDRANSIAYNALLQRICGVQAPEEFPAAVSPSFAALDRNLEHYLSVRCGDSYDELRQIVAASFGIKKSEMAKSPATVSALVTAARAKGVTFPFFDEVLVAIDAL